MGSRKLVVGYIGKSRQANVYHSLVTPAHQTVENLSGKNFKLLCDSASPAQILVFEVSKVDLAGLGYCSRCHSQMKSQIKKAKEVRFLGGNPSDNYYNTQETTFYSLTRLHIQHRQLLPDTLDGRKA